MYNELVSQYLPSSPSLPFSKFQTIVDQDDKKEPFDFEKKVVPLAGFTK